jgi:peptidoglycan L-alanyl-D-glutamate endopeptidase CwlK
MRDTSVLHPVLQEKIKKLKEECSKKGLKIGIGECYRTVAEQDALYAKGRTAPGNKVTNAKGSSYSSMHQWYVAFDFYRNDGKGAYVDNDGFFTKVGKIGVSLGLEWGGNWKSPVDKPHFQLPNWGSGPSKLKTQYGTPDKFKKSWNVTSSTTTTTKPATSTTTTTQTKGKNPYKEPTATIKKGSKGEGAQWVQWELKRLKYYTGNIDGDFGTNSDKALRAFQKAAKLTVDGKCGPGTRATLKVTK